MTAYRDDLQAAQQRIHALEQELATLREQSGQPLSDKPQTQLSVVKVDSQRPKIPTYVWIILPLLIMLLSERIPRMFPIGAIFFALVPIALTFKRHGKLSVGDNEMLLLASDNRLTGWIGPGDSVRLRRHEQAYRFPLKDRTVQVTLPAVALEDGSTVDLVVKATARLDLAPYRSSGQSESVHRALTVLGFPPHFETLAGLLGEAAGNPIRQAAKTWTRDQLALIEQATPPSDQTSTLLDPVDLDLDGFKRRYGIELSGLQVTTDETRSSTPWATT